MSIDSLVLRGIVMGHESIGPSTLVYLKDGSQLRREVYDHAAAINTKGGMLLDAECSERKLVEATVSRAAAELKTRLMKHSDDMRHPLLQQPAHELIRSTWYYEVHVMPVTQFVRGKIVQYRNRPTAHGELLLFGIGLAMDGAEVRLGSHDFGLIRELESNEQELIDVGLQLHPLPPKSFVRDHFERMGVKLEAVVTSEVIMELRRVDSSTFAKGMYAVRETVQSGDMLFDAYALAFRAESSPVMAPKKVINSGAQYGIVPVISANLERSSAHEPILQAALNNQSNKVLVFDRRTPNAVSLATVSFDSAWSQPSGRVSSIAPLPIADLPVLRYQTDSVLAMQLISWAHSA